MPTSIHIGTSGWSYDDWVGPFYPPGTPKAAYLSLYADRLDIVEVDSTFYRPPTVATVERWAGQTPPNFAFTLKMPRSITHDRVLEDCAGEMERLTLALEPLRTRLRAVLLQFGYFNRTAFRRPAEFFERLDTFLGAYASHVPLACEIRNRQWLTADYFGLLRAHRVPAALVEHVWLPPIDELCARHDVLTGPYAYVRLIGDRHGIEQTTTEWDKTVVDRSTDLRRVANSLHALARHAEVFVFVNNHYAGHAPATCRHLRTAVDSG